MLGSSCSGGLAWSGVGRAALAKRARKVEAGNSRGASQPDVASGGAGQTAQQELVDDIIQLGHMPRPRANAASAKEKRLYLRLWRARIPIENPIQHTHTLLLGFFAGIIRV